MMNTDREVLERPIPIADVILDNIKVGKNYLIDLMAGKITMQEFDKKIAYFAIDVGFDELRPQPLPTKPRELYEFDMLSLKQKEELRKNASFWSQPIIADYLKQLNMIKIHNHSNKERLKELLAIFERIGDTIFAEKVRMRLNEFI